MKLIEKFKTNFQLSNMIVRILFVVGFIFSSWQDLLISVHLVADGMSLPSGTIIPMMLLTGVIMGVILNLVVPFAINMALNFLRLYNVPRHEYILIAMMFFDIGFFACGILNLVNLFTPIFMTWGSVLFPLLTSCASMLGFYKVTSKLYFNEVTRQHYFRYLAIIYIVFAVVTGVMS